MTNDAETQALLSKFIAANASSGLWLIHDKIYTAALTNVHAVESKRDDYPLMVIYRRTGGTSDVTWTISLEKFLAKATPYEPMPLVERMNYLMMRNVVNNVDCAPMPTVVNNVDCAPMPTVVRDIALSTPFSQQTREMYYAPDTGDFGARPNIAHEWREWHGDVAWLYNPWTGYHRDPRDIDSDVYGHLIQPPPFETD